MTQYRKAQVTIFATVFVRSDDVAGLAEVIQSADAEQKAFKEIARVRIESLFPTDEPLKIREVLVDMKTFE
jgi:hypothetical protein